MRILVDVLGSCSEPYLPVHHEHAVAMLRRTSTEVGLWRSERIRVFYGQGKSDCARVIGTSGLQAAT
jgi:hypothetical protein